METNSVVRVNVSAGGSERVSKGSELACHRELNFNELVGDGESDSLVQQQLEEAFYERLIHLKEQHKKTRRSLEALYQARAFRGDRNAYCNGADGDYYGEASTDMGNDKYEAEAYELNDPTYFSPINDNIHHSVGILESGSRVALAPQSLSPECHSNSCSSHTASENETDSLSDRSEKWQTDSMEMLSNMWSDFNIDDYGDGSMDLNRQPHSSAGYWSPKFTIPEPFAMTRREEARARSGLVRSSPCIEEAERLQRQREASETAELQYQFCAREVPKATFEPRYRRICEEKARARERLMEEGKKRLEQMQRPFRFMQREQVKHKQKIEKAMALTAERNKRSAKFFAKPVPKHLFSRELTEQCLEEELYRQMRIQLRAEKLLASSHLPPSMANRSASRRYTIGELRRQTVKKRAQQAGLSREHCFHPFTNHTVPDFGELHRQLAHDLSMKRITKPSTIVQPFFLRTSLLGRSKECSCNTLHSSHDAPKTTVRAPPPTTYVPDCDASHTRSTKSSRLYRSSVQQKVEEKKKAERQQHVEAARKEELHRELAQQVSSSVLIHDHTPLLEQEAFQKIQDFRAASLARDKEYAEQVKEMNERVSSMPLLFERAVQENARRAVEKRYQNALQKAGLSEDQVNAVATLGQSGNLQRTVSDRSVSSVEMVTDSDQ